MRFTSIICLDESGARVTRRMRWGWAKRGASAPGNRPEHIHARAETIDERPTFREAFASRRGILAVNTFNEGREVTPKKTEQHTIRPRDGKPLVIAVLYERWEHPGSDDLYTFVMVTVDASALIGSITDRMPAVIQPQDWAAWLGETSATPDELKSLLKSFDGDWDMAREEKPSKPRKPDPKTDLF